MYQPILQKKRRQEDWLFLHYNQVLAKEGMDKLEEFTGAKVDRSFPTATLCRSTPDKGLPGKCLEQYKALCRLAGYQDPNL
jgi:hypothetical protein